MNTRVAFPPRVLLNATGQIVGYRNPVTDADVNTAWGGGPADNAFNGQELNLNQQSLAGAFGSDQRGVYGLWSANFNTLNNDPVVWWGLNRKAGNANAGADPWGWSEFIEGRYENPVGLTDSSGSATGGTATTIVDSGKSWLPNIWANMVVTVTRGGTVYSARVVSNTATTVTLAAAPVTNNRAQTLAAVQAGDAYSFHYTWMERYSEIGNPSTGYNFRPEFYTVDTTDIEKHATPYTVTAATAADPIVVTISATNPGIGPTNSAAQPGSHVEFSGFTGNWAELNGRIFQVLAVGGANNNQLTLRASQGSTLGAMTGTPLCYVVPRGSTRYFYSPNGQFIFGRMARSGVAACLSFAPQFAYFNGSEGSIAGTGGDPTYNVRIRMPRVLSGLGGKAAFQLEWNGNVVAEFRNLQFQTYGLSTFDSAGSNERQSFVCQRSGSQDAFNFGVGGFNYNPEPSQVTVSNVSGDANWSVFKLVPHASQARPIFAVLTTAGSAYGWFLDQNLNTVTRVAATAAADTQGFFYMPFVNAAQTGVPANVTGDYANSVPCRIDNNAGTYRLRVYVGGAWRSVNLA